MKTVQVRNITLGEGRPKICVPIVGQTKDDILLEAGTFARIPVDVVEWRVDWFEDVFDTDKVLDVAKDLQTVLKDTPILFTFRTAKEGGEKAISNEAYKALNMAVAKSGYVDLIDVEAFTGEEIIKSMIREAHSYGVKVVYHSCGSIVEAIPLLIEAGVDVIHPIQALAAGMDPANLKDKFDGKISFCGGVDTQDLLPNGTPEQVAAKVKELRTYFPTGLIVSPSHEGLQPDVPPSNIKALFDEATKIYE